MKKSDREKIFNKYGGKCAYCGDELKKGWHVDEIDPVIRKQKYVEACWKHKVTGIKVKGNDEDRYNNPRDYEYVPAKWVPDGCHYPENYRIDNQNPACASCNINKHSDTLEQFRKSISGYMKHLNERSVQYKLAKRYGLITETNIDVKFYFETL